MMFRNIYPSCERIVKGPQNRDALLRHNRSMSMCSAIFPSPAIGSGNEIFSPNLPNNLLRNHLALIQIGVRWTQEIFLPKVFHTWGTNVFAFPEISFESITNRIFRSKLGPRLELFRCICQNIEEKNLPQLGPNCVDFLLALSEY